MKFTNNNKKYNKKLFSSIQYFQPENILNKEFGNIFNIENNRLAINKIDSLNKDLTDFEKKSGNNKIIFIEAGINDINGNYKIDSVNDDLNKYISNLSEKLKNNFVNKKIYIKKDGNGIFFYFNNQMTSVKKEDAVKQEILKSSLNKDLSDLTLLFADEIHNDNAASVLRNIINLLKESGINPDYFRIGVVVDNTAASVEISV